VFPSSNAKAQPARSTFIDGEIALMIASRQTVARDPDYDSILPGRIDALVRYMSPLELVQRSVSQHPFSGEAC
jgi:hypothetical protein